MDPKGDQWCPKKTNGIQKRLMVPKEDKWYPKETNGAVPDWGGTRITDLKTRITENF